MSLKAGIVGLPNVGKSTLFNAITKQNILAANFPFATIEPNVGVVVVPDSRLTFLKKMYNPKSLVPTSISFTDIAGLVKGASKGEGLGNKFLSHIRETDAIVEVVRCFDDASITHVEGETNPIRDIEIINIELILADLEVSTSRINKIIKKAETTKDKEAILEVNTLKKVQANLEKNIPLRNVSFTTDELAIIKNFNFITLKPIIYVANINEEDIATGNNYTKEVIEYAKKEASEVIIMSAAMECILSDLTDEDKKTLFSELKMQSSGLDRLILATYKLLNLETFFTAGADECRAWTFKTGTTAKKCAGLIHSDIERGFIKAEIVSFNDLKEFGSELKVKENGKLRLEGKDYLMQDGDIVYFRFNV